MEPRPILVRPSNLPALPGYEKYVRSLRNSTILMVVYPIVILAIALARGFELVATIVVVAAFAAVDAILARSFLKERARVTATMSGEMPLVTAHEVEGGFELRSSRSSQTRGGLPVRPGDALDIVVEEAHDPRGRRRRPGYVQWVFLNGDERPLPVASWFDPDDSLLRDVERRIKALGATAETTHVPFGEKPAA